MGFARRSWVCSLFVIGAASAACGRTSFDVDSIPKCGNSNRGGDDAGGSAGVTGVGGGGQSGSVGKGGVGGKGGMSGDAGEGGEPGCVTSEVPGTRASYDRVVASAASSSSLDFFAFPWPELSRTTDDLAGFPNPATASGCSASVSDPSLAPLVAGIDPVEYRAYLNELAATYLLEGPNNAATYITFDAPIDEASLPIPALTLEASTSPILLVNVDAASPKRGRLIPALSRVFTASRYVPANTLSILPHPGFPLEPGRLYAAVVKRVLGDAAGQLLGSPAGFESLKGTEACAPAETEYTDAFALLESDLGVARDDIAIMTVFRAGNPTAVLDDAITQIDAIASPSSLASPSIDTVSFDAAGGYYLLSGSFDTLIHQFGSPPYLPPITAGFLGINVTFEATGAGRFLTEPPPTAAGPGDPSLPRTERIGFRLSIPASVTGTGSIASLPFVIFGPGTGGSLDSPFLDGSAQALAGLGVATFATDPVMHDERAHSENIDPNLISTLQAYDASTGGNTVASLLATVESGDLFFNPINLQAAKGNSLQAAVDYAWQTRVLTAANFDVDLGGMQHSISFDPSRRYFLGHSQGAATGPLLAQSQNYSAMVLSAPSGHLPSNLLGKTKPAGSLGIAQMLSYIVCDDPAEPLDVHHPFLNLLMHWFEEADAVNYAPLLITEGTSPKHVFVTSGTDDQFVPRSAHDAVTTAARLWQVSPELIESPGKALLYGATHPSVAGNFDVNGLTITGAFRQYHDAACSDDHFVYTCNATAHADWVHFIQSALGGGWPSVP
ncbi:MAG TPA: hypothetical protein VM686_31520 [Polyangiaceae bacterium]|nr:hypothetical protein [Polyangiaceae bacterium]